MPANILLDKKTFLRWAEGREGRFELHNGKIIDMTGGTTGQARLTRRIAAVIERQLDASQFEVFTTDLGVETGEQVKFPDVIVIRTSVDAKALSVTDAFVIVEVLSPSSLANDFSIKPPLYMALQSLKAYIVTSQDEPRVWHWQRDADGKWPTAPAMVEGADAKLLLTGFAGLEIPLGEIYRGIAVEQR